MKKGWQKHFAKAESQPKVQKTNKTEIKTNNQLT